MAERTEIAWCDSTFNPWIGCTRVGPGCDHCYAEMLATRYGWVTWGTGQPRLRTSPSNWRKPLQWNAQPFVECLSHGWRGEKRHLELGRECPDRRPGGTTCALLHARRRVFCASLADVFDNEVEDAWRMDLFKLIGETPNLDWLLLTKRIGNVRPYCQRDSLAFDLTESGRVWLGATVVNQEEADRDIPKLLAVPARVRFLSIEPMLGPIDLRGALGFTYPSGMDHNGNVIEIDVPPVDWVIAGGESGHGARPVHPDWIRSLRDQCAAAGVPFLFKQWGEWAPGNNGPGGDLYDIDRRKIESGMFTYNDAWTPGGPNPFRQTMDRVGKKAAGRLLDGREWNGFPNG